MNVNETITKAQALLRKGWCKDTYARNSEGGDTDPEGPEACRWCAVGALYRVIDPYGTYNVRDAVEPKLGVTVRLIAEINDNATSVDEVLAYLETLKEPT